MTRVLFSNNTHHNAMHLFIIRMPAFEIRNPLVARARRLCNRTADAVKGVSHAIVAQHSLVIKSFRHILTSKSAINHNIHHEVNSDNVIYIGGQNKTIIRLSRNKAIRRLLCPPENANLHHKERRETDLVFTVCRCVYIITRGREK